MGELLTQVYEAAVIGAALLGVPLLAYIAKSIQRINIALFGLRGDNGVIGDVKDLKRWQKCHQLEHASHGDA